MRSPCIPPSGTTYLTIGQDLFSIQEYVNGQYNASLHNQSVAPISSFFPAAVMSYTDLASLRGLDKPVDYGSGVEYADGLLESLFPGSGVGIQIGLWLGGKEGCDKINNGEMEKQLEILIKYLEHCAAAKIFLRIGYEFDNPSFGYSSDPFAYAEAFRKIVHICQEKLSNEKQAKVKFVWHSWAAPTSEGVELDDFYPGDDYVDWIGVSIFQQVYPWSPPWAGKLKDVERVMTFSSDHKKPTMIAESTPFGGIDLSTEEVRSFGKEDPWDRWFQEVLLIIDKYDVSMWCYINCAWDQQPMWHSIGFGETRLSTNNGVMENWKKIVIDGKGGRQFLLAGSLENCGEGRIRNDVAQKDGFGLGAFMLSRTSASSNPLVDSGILFWAIAICSLTAMISVFLFRNNCSAGIISWNVRPSEDTASERSPMIKG